MKVGIVTQPLSANYGGILQNYALQQALKKIGHEPFTFDLGKYTWCDWFVVVCKTIIKKCLKRNCSFPETPTQKKRIEQPLRDFVLRKIKLMHPRCKRLDKSLVDKYKLDALVVGSDQVWRPLYNYYISDMFFDFAKDKDVKRVAYAASFGTDNWEYNATQENICKSLAKKFDAVSVREDSGVMLCKEKLDVSAEHVLDPTLLLDVEEYKKLTEGCPEDGRKILFAYILNPNDEKIRHINSVAEKLDLIPVIKGAEGNVDTNDSIEGWLSLFRDARYVITDSFHGSVFSIIYNVDFHAIGNMNRGLSRMMSLLKSFGLESRLLSESSLEKAELAEIDWSSVNLKKSELKEMSVYFLQNALK